MLATQAIQNGEGKHAAIVPKEDIVKYLMVCQETRSSKDSSLTTSPVHLHSRDILCSYRDQCQMFNTVSLPPSLRRPAHFRQNLLWLNSLCRCLGNWYTRLNHPSMHSDCRRMGQDHSRCLLHRPEVMADWQ